MKAPIVVVALFLAGCATWPAGEDPKGRELKTEATPVLYALAKYHKDKGEFPSSLYELVPRYIKEVPFGPDLRLARDRNIVEFVYTLSWPRLGRIACVASLGETEWSCRPYLKG